jgi:hypothetical protein
VSNDDDLENYLRVSDGCFKVLLNLTEIFVRKHATRTVDLAVAV